MAREPSDSGVHFAAVRRAVGGRRARRTWLVPAVVAVVATAAWAAHHLLSRPREDPAPAESRWVAVPAGTFTMGSTPAEVGHAQDETLHEVTLSRPFLVLSTEVTQADFARRMGRNPSYFSICGPGCPVERVTWHDAAAYCNALSEEEGLEPCYLCTGRGEALSCVPRSLEHDAPAACPGYRLPTEAEWERAARLDGDGPTPRGPLRPGMLECERSNPVLEPIAWFCGSSGARPHVVGALEPTAPGLHDLLGNVWEWTGDPYGPLGGDAAVDPAPAGEGPRVVRGCGWLSFARECRAARRSRQLPEGRYGDLGFRPVRTASGP